MFWFQGRCFSFYSPWNAASCNVEMQAWCCDHHHVACAPFNCSPNLSACHSWTFGWREELPSWELTAAYISHRIHASYGIFTYIYHKKCRYIISYMDPMGICVTSRKGILRTSILSTVQVLDSFPQDKLIWSIPCIPWLPVCFHIFQLANCFAYIQRFLGFGPNGLAAWSQHEKAGKSPGNSPSWPIRSWLPWLPCDVSYLPKLVLTYKNDRGHIAAMQISSVVCTFWWILYGSFVHFSSEENIPFDNTILFLGNLRNSDIFTHFLRQMEQTILYCNCYC